MKRKTRYILCGLVPGLVFAWILVMSLLTVWIGDDIDYMFMIHDSIWDSSGGIKNMTDLFTSMYFHYIYVNGRYVAHWLVQLFCGMLGQIPFAIANGAVWCLFVWLLAKTSLLQKQAESYHSNKVTPSTLATVSLLALISFVTKMMPTCQIGFVWMFTLVLGWVYLYRTLGSRKIGWWWLPLLFFFSVLAGNGQEAINVGIAVALFFEALRKRFRFTSVEWVMLSGFAIGCAFLCFTPAMFGRVDTIRLTHLQSLCNTLLSLRAFYVMLAVVIYALTSKRLRFRDFWRMERFWLIAIAALFAMNFVIKVYCNRQLMGIELCSVIVAVHTLHRHSFNAWWMGIFTVIAMIMMWFQCTWVLDSRKQFQEIERLYVESRKGVVFYDRYRSSASPQALLARYNENVIGPHNGDLRHGMGKYFRAKYPDKKCFLTVLPTRLNPDSANVEYGTVSQYYPGHFMVLVDSTRRHRLLVHHELNVPVIHVPAASDTVDYGYNYTKRSAYSTYLIIPEDPARRVTGVEIIYDK